MKNQTIYDDYAITGWPCHFCTLEAVKKYNAKIESYCQTLKDGTKDLTFSQRVRLWFYIRYLDVYDVLLWSIKKRRLEKLFKSKNPADRRQAAKLGYKLDVLVHDPHFFVREAVALRGHGLEKLVHDEDPRVRLAVAQQRYGLDILIHDEMSCVRDCAKIMMDKQQEAVAPVNTLPYEE